MVILIFFFFLERTGSNHGTKSGHVFQPLKKNENFISSLSGIIRELIPSLKLIRNVGSLQIVFAHSISNHLLQVEKMRYKGIPKLILYHSGVRDEWQDL